ncbi:sulfotransferase [Shimia sp. W99]
MAGQSFKAGDKLRAAAAAEKAGRLDEARALFSEVVARFPGNAKAKAGLKRVGSQKGDGFPAGLEQVVTPDPLAALSGARLSGIEDPFAVPAKPVATAPQPQSLGALTPGAVPSKGADAGMLAKRAVAAHGRGQLAEAVSLFDQAVVCDPARTDLRHNLGVCLREAGRFDEARAVLETAVEREPLDPDLRATLGLVLSDMDAFDAARACFEQVVKAHPDHVTALSGLGAVYSATGQTEQALAQYEELVARHPEETDAYVRIGALRRFEAGDPVLARLEGVLRKGRLSNVREAEARFALGKAQADLGEIDSSFSSLVAANKAARRARPYDRAGDARRMAQVRSWFESGASEQLVLPEVGHGAVSPIFIVGMPRSGSSLIEQVLASHSRVYGAGEIGVFDAIMATVVRERPEGARLDKPLLRDIRDAYLGEVARLAAPKRVVTDKNLMNFRDIGVILAAFPEARVIHMRRDAMAVCWSIFKHSFSGGLINFSYDLDDIAAFYLMYRAQMAFWHETFPGRILDLDYDAFTQAPEESTRQLLKDCGLPFEEACLAFHETRRTARTASMIQVREKVYQGSSRAWQPYRAHLGPLMEQIGYTVEP